LSNVKEAAFKLVKQQRTKLSNNENETVIE